MHPSPPASPSPSPSPSLLARSSRVVSAASLAVALLAVACSGASDPVSSGTSATAASDAGPATGEDASTDAGTTFTPATHPPLPIIPNQGGPIVAHPEVVTITWASDPLAPDLEAFDDWMVASSFWQGLMGEWGVGPGTHGKSYRVPTPAPATLDDGAVQALIADAIVANDLPAPSADRIYAVYPPAGTEVTNFGAIGCQGFQAYHYSFTPAGASALAVYAITPRCASTPGMTPLDYTTWGMSHEIMEAASDPDWAHPAYVIQEQSLLTPEPGENADLCTGHPTRVDGHMVTRNWSNVAAKNGDRPCAPATPGPGFGVYADPGEIAIAPGETVTVKVRAWSGAPMPRFKVIAYAASDDLTAKLGGTSAENGDELTMTLTASASFAADPAANLVYLVAADGDYTTRASLIVRGK
jgi:hypothetical protein